MSASQQLHILILAGGESTRIRTGGPKALLDLCGAPLLEHIFRATDSLAAGQRAIVLGPKHQQPIETWMEKAGRLAAAPGMEAQPGQKSSWQVAIQPIAKGTGDAVMCGLQALPDAGRLLILCGDTPLLDGETLEFLAEQNSGCLLTALVDDPTGYGRILREEESGDLMAIVEEADASEDIKKIAEVNAGVYLLDIVGLRKALGQVNTNNAQGEFYLPDAAVALLRETEGSIVCLEDGEEEILGVNTLTEFAFAGSILRQRRLLELMENGVIIDDPSTAFIEVDTEIAPGARIMPYCVIRAGSKIGPGCEVGPFAHVRVGTVMEEKSVLGNFVETKNTVLHSGAKAKHLTYLGDAQVGARANIGCGTITANYDGKHKHPTIIGERAFIGSGTVLVAPVKIGNDAMTAAGCVVTRGKDVPDHGVVAGVPARPLPAKKLS